MDFNDLIFNMIVTHNVMGLSADEALKKNLRAFAAKYPITRLGETADKCVRKSTSARVKANEAFARGLFENARVGYTLSLSLAPPFSMCASIAHANRSAALYHLKAYKECINDIECALSLPCPKNKMPKIISRKKDALAKLTANCSINHETESQNDDKILAYGANPEASGLSKGITIAYNNQHGRHLVAAKTFQAGDILVVQQPFSSWLLDERIMSHCTHCLNKTVAPIPCDNCTTAIFCSEECKTLALRSYHRIECDLHMRDLTGFNNDDYRNTAAAMSLRLFVVLTNQGETLGDLEKEIKDVENSKDPRKLGFTGEKFVANSSRAFFGLPLQILPEVLHLFAYQAACLVIMLRNQTNFFKSNADVKLGAKILLNVLSIAVANFEHMKCYEKEQTLAYTVYPFSHMIHHACVSNTISYVLKDNTMVIRACQLIKPGEQIFSNYLGRDCILMDTSERQELIKSMRLNFCRCQACKKKHDFKSGRRQTIKIDENLREKLKENPFDISSMWKVLEIVQREVRQPSTETEIMKRNLINVYTGKKNMMVPISYVGMGIL